MLITIFLMASLECTAAVDTSAIAPGNKHIHTTATNENEINKSATLK